MKKISLVVLMMCVCVGGDSFFADTVLASFDFKKSEVNVKVGVDGGENNLKTELNLNNVIRTADGRMDSEVGFSLAGEYLVPVSDIFKIGAGLEYLLPRKPDKNYEIKFAYLPIYLTAQVNPFSSAKGVFFKGNVGYVVLFDTGKFKDQFVSSVDYKKKGGIYCAFGTGYEFPFGLVLELMYSYYRSEVKMTAVVEELNIIQYHKVGVNVGYKFKL
ncbi:MAG: hypothetical protein LBT18_00410 [Endomicrobium sp.]|jgi:hypothetical protein|nr:hypothetical protein [Endomicrobium sp.]